MKATQQLHDLCQSLWQDNITRMLHDDGTLVRYSAENSITGLTSNPSIFAAAIGSGDVYDAGIHAKTLAGLAGDALWRPITRRPLHFGHRAEHFDSARRLEITEEHLGEGRAPESGAGCRIICSLLRDGDRDRSSSVGGHAYH